METEIRRYVGVVQTQLAAVLGPHQYLLAPVAQYVACYTGIGLGAVVPQRAFHCQQRLAGSIVPVILAYDIPVQQLTQQVTVPPYSHIDRCHGLHFADEFLPGRNQLAGERTYPIGVGTPHLHSGMGGINVGGHATAYILVALELEDNLAGTGVTQ